jgi:hypothetical protein
MLHSELGYRMHVRSSMPLVRIISNEQRTHFALILYRYAVGLIRSLCTEYTYHDKSHG